MLYKVIESLGTSSGDKWLDYLKWTHQKQLTEFASVDSNLRKSYFVPQSAEDWANCVNQDCYIELITNLAYARHIQAKYNDDAVVVGVEIDVDRGYKTKSGFVGFDIIDSFCNISLITNWLPEDDLFSGIKFQNNGLISKLDTAIAVRDLLRNKFADDAHAKDCTVWAVYAID